MISWRPFLFLTYLLSTLTHGQEPAAVAKELAEIPSYQYGLTALSDFLPDQAAKRFEAARTTPELSPAAQLEISMRIAECNVRAGKGSLALSLLKNTELLKHPHAPYWYAQALAASGQFEEATKAFSKIPETDPFYGEALLSNARLHQSLGNQEKAVAILEVAIKHPSPETAQAAALLLAETMLETNQLDKAQEYLANIPDSAKPGTIVTQNYLLGRLHLANDKLDLALSIFDELLSPPEYITQRIYHGSALAKADTLASGGNIQEALSFLASFIDQHPDSPMLVYMLERIAHWMPDNPSARDPIMLKLQEWSLTQEADTELTTSFIPGTTILQQPTAPDSVRTLEPSTNLTPQYPDLAASALFHLALITSTQDSPGSSSRALILLAYLRAQYPTHILSQRSLLETAKIQLDEGLDDRSINTLEILQANVISPKLKQNAAFIQGQLEANRGQWDAAREAFTKASESLNQETALAALINAGSAALREGNLAAFDERYSKITDVELRTQLSLEKALWLHSNSHPEARTILAQFLSEHHKHPRHTEVRLALAAACIESQPIDTIRAETELHQAKPELTTDSQFYEFARIKIQLAELENLWADVINIAKEFLEQYPDHEDNFNMTLRMGEAMMRNGELNKARQVLGKLVLEQPQHPFTVYAIFFQAMAARGENTPQSLLEAVEIFQQVIDSKSPLASEAAVQQARILIDMDQLQRAESSLKTHYATAPSSLVKKDLGILLADTYRRQLGQDPKLVDKAIEIYKQLIELPDLNQSSSNQLHSFLGETYESIERLDLALDVYLNVINSENLTDPSAPSQEWHWYYECAFDALTILQDAERWRSAVAIAKRIAASNGPRKEEALAIARELSVKHMIWAD